MEEQIVALGHLSAPIEDLDLTPRGDPVALLGKSPVKLHAAGREVTTPFSRLAFPLLRAVDEDRVVVVERRTRGNAGNAWVLDRDGALLASFRVGDGVEDVLASERAILVTYFDEGVTGSPGPNRKGAAVFDPDGTEHPGLLPHLRSRGVDIVDCYCAAWAGPTRAVLCPYPGFPLLTFDLERDELQAEETPPAVHGAKAVSVDGPRVFFFSPSSLKGAMVVWDRRTGAVKESDRLVGPFRGLPAGRFLAVGEAGYTVLTPS